MAAPSTPTQVSSIFRGLGITGVHGSGTFDPRSVSAIHRATTNAAQSRAKKVTFRMKDFAGARAANRSIPNLGKIPSSQGKSLISPKLAKAAIDKLFSPSSATDSFDPAETPGIGLGPPPSPPPVGGSSFTPSGTGTLGGM
tara:strand:- start:401 stop:823 length:423 start_codon:yes stop_codon:yes gene_type:complete